MIRNDSLTREGAMALANQIKAYWGKRGASVQTWLEEIQPFQIRREVFYCVRSNLVNGLPPANGAALADLNPAALPQFDGRAPPPVFEPSLIDE